MARRGIRDQSWFEKWLTHWVENIAGQVVRKNTLDGYRKAVCLHLIPGVKAHRLDPPGAGTPWSGCAFG
jgi:hypothetical protein